MSDDVLAAAAEALGGEEALAKPWEPALEAEPGEEAAEAHGDGDPEVEPQPEGEEPLDGEEAEAAPEEETEEAATAGSQDDPLTIDDIPEDEYIRVRIDGEERVMTMREAVQGGMMKATFDRRAHELKQLQERTQQVAQTATEKLQRYEQGLEATFSSTQAAFKFMLNNHPGTLVDFLDQGYRWLHEKSGGTREGVEALKREMGVRQRERLLEQRARKADEQQRRAKLEQTVSQRRATVAPALAEARKQVGFSTALTAEQMREIGTALDVRERANGRPLTAAEITEVAARWLRTYGDSSPAERKPRKPRHRKAPRATKAPEVKRDSRGRFQGSTTDGMGNPSTDYIASLVK